MFYKDWEPIYRKILEDFNFQVENDKKSADVLNQLLKKRKPFSIKELEDIITGKEVVIFGAGPSLESSLITHKKDLVGKLKIAADGATSALMENNVFPEIIVTDLDGKITDQLEANSKGSITIIHAHGDNIDKVKKFVLEFKGNIVGTTQTNPKPYENIHNFGGFTDGDRAVFLAEHFNAKKTYLIGFDFDDEIGRYSFSANNDKKLKLKKLKWCKYLIELLKKHKQNIDYL